MQDFEYNIRRFTESLRSKVLVHEVLSVSNIILLIPSPLALTLILIISPFINDW